MQNPLIKFEIIIIIYLLDAYVKNNQNWFDEFKGKMAHPIWGQLKLLSLYKNAINDATPIKTQFDNWYLTMFVFSFNGIKYHIKLTTQILHKSLEDYGEMVSFTIKNTNSYRRPKNQHWQFLVIRGYSAPKSAYDAFIKAHEYKFSSVTVWCKV